MRFSQLMLSVCALITVNGCAYIIPPEQNAPRHNTVLGGPRRPQMNLVSGPLSALTPTNPSANYATAAPVVPVTVAAQQAPQNYAAPVAPAAIAPEPIAQQTFNAPVATTVQAEAPRTTLLGIPMPSISRTYSSIVGSNDAPALPAVDPTVKAQAERELAAAMSAQANANATNVNRQLPVENQQFQVAGNYPPLDSVPPRPALTGTDSTQSRLNATQADLTRDRAQAQQSTDALARDAAAEPSLLAPMPPTQNLAPVATTPALPAATLPVEQRRAPIGNGAATTPTAAPAIVANAAPAPRIVLPTTPIINQFSVPTGPSFAPPAPLNMASLNVPVSQPVRIAPVDQPVAIQPTVNAPAAAIATTGQRQPIVLRAPVPYEAAPAPAPAPSRGGITVRPGDFDPLTGADNSPLAAPSTATAQSTSASALADYATNRAIAPSRYDAIRN